MLLKNKKKKPLTASLAKMDKKMLLDEPKYLYRKLPHKLLASVLMLAVHPRAEMRKTKDFSFCSVAKMIPLCILTCYGIIGLNC